MAFKRHNFVDNTVLKAHQLNEMEDAILANETWTIPEYWQEHIATKVEQVNNVNGSNGSDGVAFVFITDTHFPHNTGNGVALINEVIRNTSVRKVFFGGDVIHCDTIGKEALTIGRNLVKSFIDNSEVYPMRGNHDISSTVTESKYWDIFYRNIGRFCHSDGKMYYYSDDEYQKIRYIVLDAVTPESAVGSAYLEQLEWMKEKISELSNEWSVLLFQHSVWNGGNNALSAHGQALVNSIDDIYDSASCTIVGILSGHNHTDRYEKRNKGYVLISTGCDRILDGVTVKDTTTEQLFDVVNINLKTKTIKMTRIGRGSDRTITY